MKKTSWKPLQKNDLIDIIAPASRCPDEELQAGVKVLESWGYRVRVPKNIFGTHWTHAHSDEQRFEQLKAALYSSDSKAIWCVRGGYGSLKLLPFLSQLKPPQKAKLFLGLSDVTSLHLFFNQKWSWSTLHAPVLSRIGRGDLPKKTINELKQVIAGQIQELQYKLKPLNQSALDLFSKDFKPVLTFNINNNINSNTIVNPNGPINGILVGGNFTTLQASIGTPFCWKPQNTILFLEDVGERAYRLDRMWEHFLQAGLLTKAKAIVLGDFTEGHEKNGIDLTPKFIKERAQQLKIPVFSGLPVGHGSIQRVLPLGATARIH